jgi:hypothetical protein
MLTNFLATLTFAPGTNFAMYAQTALALASPSFLANLVTFLPEV